MPINISDALVEEINNETRSNKREERFQLLKFVNTFVDFPKCKYIPRENPDCPDLEVETSDGILAVEHTRILREPLLTDGINLREQETLQDKILIPAKQLHDECDGQMLWLYVTCNWCDALSSKEIESIATQLAQVVEVLNASWKRDVMEENWCVTEAWEYRQRFTHSFPSKINRVEFRYVDNPKMVLWNTIRGTTVPNLEIKQVQTVITKKEAPLKDYQHRFVEVWLLITTNGGAPSSYFNLPLDVAEHEYTSRFSRAFCMDVFSQAIHELRVKSL